MKKVFICIILVLTLIIPSSGFASDGTSYDATFVKLLKSMADVLIFKGTATINYDDQTKTYYADIIVPDKSYNIGPSDLESTDNVYQRLVDFAEACGLDDTKLSIGLVSETTGLDLYRVGAEKNVAFATESETTVTDEKLSDPHDTGMWIIGYYVDEFEKPTTDKYIRNSSWITGNFSNSATHKSPLNVRFLIDGNDNIAIQLYEYAGAKPVKAYKKDKYSVTLLDSNDKRHYLEATNYFDRLNFNAEDSKTIHAALMQNGSVSFYIVDQENHLSEYTFTIPDTSYYNNAYALLK